MGSKIQNIEELRFELKRLKKSRTLQESELNKDIKDFQRKFSVLGSVLGYFSPFGSKSKDGLLLQNSGMASLGMLLVDKLLLNNSGTIVKTISGLLFTKLASNVTKDDIVSLIEKVKGWFKRSEHKEDLNNKTEDKNDPTTSDQLE